MSVRQGKETRHDSASGVLKGIAGAGAALATEDGALDPVFRLIFDHIGIGLWQSTPEGRYLRVNQSCADLMGYESPEAAVDAIGDIAREIYVEPSERDAFKSLLTRDGAVTGFVARHRRRDGSEWWARLSAVAVRGADGQPKFYVGSAEDVTALIETQEQLRAAERDMREVWENAAEGMYRSSPDGKQLRANPALVRLNGYATEADMLSGVNDIASEWYVDPTRRDEFKRILREHGRVTDFQSEVYRHKTRERIWVSENAWEVRDEGGRLQYYEGSVRDITAEKRAAQRLGESEQRFRDYADTASDWFWESDREHRFTYLSSSERRPNLRDSAVIGKKRWDPADDVAEEPARRP